MILLIDYLFHGHIALACLGALISLLLVYLIAYLWGRLWNRLWWRWSIEPFFLVPLIFWLPLYLTGTAWIGGNAMQAHAQSLRECPAKIIAEAEQISTNDYACFLTEEGVYRASKEKENECRLLLLAKDFENSHLYMSPVRCFFSGGIPLSAKSIPPFAASRLDAYFKTIWVSSEDIRNLHGKELSARQKCMTQWAANAMRYMLIRQNIELLAKDESGLLNKFKNQAILCFGILLLLFILIITWVAYADIKPYPDGRTDQI